MPPPDAPFLTDLQLVFRNGGLDLADAPGPASAVSGLDNLVQALTLRLSVDRGELAGLGHPGYGTRLRELLGELTTRANLELLRRIVRRSLLADPRVAEVVAVVVTPRPAEPGRVDVAATVRAVSGGEARVTLVLHG